MLERCVILSEKGRIETEVLPAELCGFPGDRATEESGKEYSLKKMSRLMEEQLIRKALGKTRGNRTHAAQRLRIDRSNLIRLMKRLGIE